MSKWTTGNTLLFIVLKRVTLGLSGRFYYFFNVYSNFGIWTETLPPVILLRYWDIGPLTLFNTVPEPTQSVFDIPLYFTRILDSY